MKYYELEPENNTFKSLVVDITHRCNMHCANCYIPNRDIPDMDIDKLYEFLKHLPKRTYIRLIGAEPTMRDDLCDIIYNVQKLGHRPSLTTNGLKLSRLDYTKSLYDAGLKMVLISMNGADDDNAYKLLDNGKYANLKIRALSNIVNIGFQYAVGCIIGKGLNEQCIERLPKLLEKITIENNKTFKTKPWNRLAPAIRFKSIGALGRHIENHSYTYNELVKLASEKLNLNQSEFLEIENGTNFLKYAKTENGCSTQASLVVPYQTSIGTLFIRFIDWIPDTEGVPDPGSTTRGRVTKDWKIAPFFEHIKTNEFGY